MDDWAIYLRDAGLQRLAQLDDFQKLDAVARFNAVGSWTLDLRPDSDAAAMLGSGEAAGIELTRDDLLVFSGPAAGRLRKLDGNNDTLTFTGLDDNCWLARRLAAPEAPALTTATSAEDLRTGAAETIMRAYVDANAGPSALAERRALTLAPIDYLRGGTVTGHGRWQPLIELLAELALAGGDLGFRVAAVGGALQFQVYEPADLSADVTLSLGVGSLAGYDFQLDAPEATFVVAGGEGSGAARAVATSSDDNAAGGWGRIEKFEAADSSGASLQAQADAALTKYAAKGNVALQTSDLPQLAFGLDYQLGDKVSAQVEGERLLDEIVREANITLDGDGAKVRLTVAAAASTDPRVPGLFGRLADAERRLRDLERRQ